MPSHGYLRQLCIAVLLAGSSSAVARAQAEIVQAGGNFTCAVLTNGKMKCWGANSQGTLGIGDTLNRGTAANQMGVSLPWVSLSDNGVARVIDLSLGHNHGCAIVSQPSSANPMLKCWGNNANGRLGLGHVLDQGDAPGEMGDGLSMVSLGGSRYPVQVSAGNNHSCAILDDGSLKCWGDNANGRLGLGNTVDRGDGANEMGDSLSTVSLASSATVDTVSVGNGHTCVILSNDKLKCWGSNSFGELGLEASDDRGDSANEMGTFLNGVNFGTSHDPLAVSAGEDHNCAIVEKTDTGEIKVKCWGSNASGQLGLGDTLNRGYTSGQMGGSLPKVDLGAGHWAREISSGYTHSCALLDDYSVKCWGSNSQGELGQGDTMARGDDTLAEMGDSLPTIALGTGRYAVSVEAGDRHTCVVLDNGMVKCWGDGVNGRLGKSSGDVSDLGNSTNEMGDSLSTVVIGTAMRILTGAHTCAKLSGLTGDNVKCWGEASSSRLGYGDLLDRGASSADMGANLPIVPLGTFNVLDISRAVTQPGFGAHWASCALSSAGTVKCWGGNSRGDLGSEAPGELGDTLGEMGDSLSTLRFGSGRTVSQLDRNCVILDDKSVKCWGDITQYGFGDTDIRGDESGEMGDSLPTIALPTGLGARQISGGVLNKCVILTDGTLRCFGQNGDGALGLGDENERNEPEHMGDNLATVDLGEGKTARQIAIDGLKGCAILDDYSVKCWGKNSLGTIGVGDTFDRGDDSLDMGDNLSPISIGAGRLAREIRASGNHTCVILDDGSVKCWGSSNSGELGYGDENTRGDSPSDMGTSLTAVALGTNRVALELAVDGNGQTCVVLDDLTVKCWGYNLSGQLGIGDSFDRGDHANEMGDSLPTVRLE